MIEFHAKDMELALDVENPIWFFVTKGGMCISGGDGLFVNKFMDLSHLMLDYDIHMDDYDACEPMNPSECKEIH
jgi:hypothetical protein